MTADRPYLSIVVPAHQAAGLLPDTLGALRASASPGLTWELIVVDDGSIDGTSEVAARFADRVIRLQAPSIGPAGARNAGAAVARGEWLLFVDSDVRVRPETLRQFCESTRGNPAASAIFGVYDATPEARGLVSRYRNLLHRYVHLRGAGPAETFWGGLGGVRLEVFQGVGGFNPSRYPRPQIEDIELGYRLRDAGVVIMLDPAIQGTHLKGWYFRRMAVTDFRDRAIPWMRLLLERQGKHRATLNVAWGERFRVGLAGMALAAALAALVLQDWMPAGAAVGLLALLIASNLSLYRWFADQGGFRFAIAVTPLSLWYYLSNAVAAGVAVLAHLARRAWLLVCRSTRSQPGASGVARPGVLPSRGQTR